MKEFTKGSAKEIKVYDSEKTVKYDSETRIGVGISEIGTSRAISLRAYAFALNSLDKR
jgi:hypothetical protein